MAFIVVLNSAISFIFGGCEILEAPESRLTLTTCANDTFSCRSAHAR